MERRVVITGLGALTPIGNTTKDFWEGIKEGKCGIQENEAREAFVYASGNRKRLERVHNTVMASYYQFWVDAVSTFLYYDFGGTSGSCCCRRIH